MNLSNLEVELNRVINDNVNLMDTFIAKKIRIPFIGAENRKEFIRLLPIIISHTNVYNCDWLEDFYFIEGENFYNVLLENLTTFNLAEDEDGRLFSRICFAFRVLDLDKQQAKKLIDKVLECNVEWDYCKLYFLYITIELHELVEYMLEKYITTEKACRACISFMLEYGKGLHLCYSNINFILKNIDRTDLIGLKDWVKDNEEVTFKIKRKIEENKKEVIIDTLRNLYTSFLDDDIKLGEGSRKQLEVILEVVYLLIEDVCKNEQIQVSDIEILGSGAFSKAIRIGEKVLKIGCKRGTKTFIDNPYVVAMLLRKEFPVDEGVSFFVEVDERVDTKCSISLEELYQLYKKVRELHLIWIDVELRNVGRLLRDNQVHWRQELPITDERLGLQQKRGNEVLKAGEVVILDNDFIYGENEPIEIIQEYSTPLQEQFEERYQREKRESQQFGLEEVDFHSLEENEVRKR